MDETKMVCPDCGNDTFHYNVYVNEDGSMERGHYVTCAECGSTGAVKPDHAETEA